MYEKVTHNLKSVSYKDYETVVRPFVYHVAQIIFSWHIDVQTDNDVVDANDILDQIHHR